MDYKKIIFIFIIFSNVISCNDPKQKKKMSNNKNTDSFYTQTGSFDYERFPVIKPFEVVSLDNQNSWGLTKGFNTSLIADNITQFFSLNNIIFCHCEGETVVNDTIVNEAWYMVDIKNDSIEKGFRNQKDFLDYLKNNNISSNSIVWKTPSELFKQFNETGCLPWIPNCK